ncbi:MAG: aminodeoxychorismate/anthranilate synthase component II [Bacteroidales bacterium]|jgi:anthranilate synthase component 2|nr:aminodeoxychorismate/anthranilate synthase component II [Bacteroidales bacterium]
MEKILVFDNYDSFTYNLVQALKAGGCRNIDVVRNDKISLDEINEYDGIVLSPGPGIPEEAGLLIPLIRRYAPYKRILGICLGMQAIGEAFGGSLVNLSEVYHGVADKITVINNDPLFKGIADKNGTFTGGRYHSWVISRKGFPSCLQVTAEDDNGQIMALRHNKYDVCGLQFHPESVLTPDGQKIINNWLDL